MDYRDYIPSAKTISVWTMLIGLCAMSALLFCSSCKTVQGNIADTVYVTRYDTLKEIHHVKDTETEKMFQSLIERMEMEKNTLHTLILSEKGDTLKEYHETIIEKNSTTEKETYRELIQAITDSLNSYKKEVSMLIEKMHATEVVDSRNGFEKWFDNVKSNVFYIVIGILLIAGIIVYLRKKWK